MPKNFNNIADLNDDLGLAKKNLTGVTYLKEKGIGYKLEDPTIESVAEQYHQDIETTLLIKVFNMPGTLIIKTADRKIPIVPEYSSLAINLGDVEPERQQIFYTALIKTNDFMALKSAPTKSPNQSPQSSPTPSLLSRKTYRTSSTTSTIEPVYIDLAEFIANDHYFAQLLVRLFDNAGYYAVEKSMRKHKHFTVIDECSSGINGSTAIAMNLIKSGQTDLRQVKLADNAQAREIFVYNRQLDKASYDHNHGESGLAEKLLQQVRDQHAREMKKLETLRHKHEQKKLSTQEKKSPKCTIC